MDRFSAWLNTENGSSSKFSLSFLNSCLTVVFETSAVLSVLQSSLQIRKSLKLDVTPGVSVYSESVLTELPSSSHCATFNALSRSKL